MLANSIKILKLLHHTTWDYLIPHCLTRTKHDRYITVLWNLTNLHQFAILVVLRLHLSRFCQYCFCSIILALPNMVCQWVGHC